MSIEKMKDYCRWCGGWKGIHEVSSGRCPVGGKEAPPNKKQEYTFQTYLEKNPFVEAAPKLYKALKDLLPYAENDVNYLREMMDDDETVDMREQMQKDYSKACEALAEAQNAIKMVEHNLPEKLPDGRFNA